MMNTGLKKLIKVISLLLFFLMLTGCMPKQADGKYQTQYSYHPYYSLYGDEITKSKPRRESRIQYRPLSKPRYEQTYKSHYTKKYKPYYKKANTQREEKRYFNKFTKKRTRVRSNDDEEEYPSNVPIRR